MDDAQPAEKSGGEALSSLNFTERAALHSDLRVIANAAQMAVVHIDMTNATVGELLTMYDHRWGVISHSRARWSIAQGAFSQKGLSGRYRPISESGRGSCWIWSQRTFPSPSLSGWAR